MLKIFIGSSNETLEELSMISAWVKEAGIQPIPWNDSQLSRMKGNTSAKLTTISGSANAEKLTAFNSSADVAVFIFSEDDKVWCREGSLNQSQDNVLEEKEKVTFICKVGETKIPANLHDLLILNISTNNHIEAKIKFRTWLEEQKLFAAAKKFKICMVGSYGVGKTSLVRRFVKNEYDEKYQTTMGVKVDKKIIKLDGRYLMLLLWDLEGVVSKNGIISKKELGSRFWAYLRGTDGFLLVADGTRPHTLQEAQSILKLNIEESGKIVPYIMLVNKADLIENWPVEAREIGALARESQEVLMTSAKTGMNVERAFLLLAQLLSGVK